MSPEAITSNFFQNTYSELSLFLVKYCSWFGPTCGEYWPDISNDRYFLLP